MRHLLISLSAVVSLGWLAHIANGKPKNHHHSANRKPKTHHHNAPMPEWKEAWTWNGPRSGPSRRAHHATVVIDDEMIVFGGHNQNYELQNDIWSFDLNKSFWRRVKPAIADGTSTQGVTARAGKLTPYL